MAKEKEEKPKKRVRKKQPPRPRKPLTKAKTREGTKSGNQGDGGGIKERVLTEEEIKQVEKLAAYLSQDQLADYLGIARSTFFNIGKRQPEVVERYKRGRSNAIGMVSTSLLSQAREGNTTAAIFYLKTQAGWKETQVIDNTSSDGTMSPTKIEIVAPAVKKS